jgi:hypothetical protein
MSSLRPSVDRMLKGFVRTVSLPLTCVCVLGMCVCVLGMCVHVCVSEHQE